jgi:hypothetical protein
VQSSPANWHLSAAVSKAAQDKYVLVSASFLSVPPPLLLQPLLIAKPKMMLNALLTSAGPTKNSLIPRHIYLAQLSILLLINANLPERIALQLSALIMKFKTNQMVLHGAQSTGPTNALTLKFKT